MTPIYVRRRRRVVRWQKCSQPASTGPRMRGWYLPVSSMDEVFRLALLPVPTGGLADVVGETETIRQADGSAEASANAG